MASFSVIRRAVLLAVLGQPILPVIAQDGGVLLTFGLRERLSYGNNLDLASPAEGRTLRAATELSFGLVSETRTQRLSVRGSTALTFSDEPGSGSVTEIRDPDFRLDYQREAANAAVSVNAFYRRQDVSTFEFGQLVDEDGDGTIDLPEDLSELIGEGTRADYRLGTRLDLGTSAPIGLSFGAAVSGVDYSGTTDPSLNDIRRTDLSATARLRVDDATQGTLTLAYATYDEDDPADTSRRTSSVSAGLQREVSAATVIGGSLGYTIIDNTEFGTTTREQGLTGEVSLRRDLPNGTFDARVSAGTDLGGNRVTLSFGRSLELPAGVLSARFGITRHEGDGPVAIGELRWRRDLPTGRVTFAAVRSAESDADGIETVRTALSLGYSHDITELDGINVGMNWVAIDEEGSPGVTRTSLTASYQRALTEDWDMVLGATVRLRDEDGGPSARSNEVFLSIGREFQLRP